MHQTHASAWLFCFAFAVVLALAPFTTSRADDRDRVSIAGMEVGDTTITIGVSVSDADGNPVAGLGPDDFALQVDGQPLEVTAVEAGADAALPIAITVVVDTSGSMSGEALRAAQAGVSTLVNSLAALDAAEILSFANRVQTVVPLTTDRSALLSGIGWLDAVGNTALYDAIGTAATSAAGSGYPRHAVVFLADGEDYGAVSTLDRDGAMAAAAASGVPFYVVAVGADIDAGLLQQLATDTGGDYFAAATPGDIERLYAEISESLRLQYTLSASLPSNLAGGKHSITVSAGGGVATNSFTTAGDEPSGPTSLSLLGFEPTLGELAVVTVAGDIDATNLTWLLDGETVATGVSSLTLDPFALAPAADHDLAVRYDDGSRSIETSSTFFVPKLPPQILSPLSLPELRAGDIIRLDIASQTAPVVVEYRIDGAVVEVDDGAPYEFVVPRLEQGGDATFSIVASDPHGSTELDTTVSPFGGGGSSPAGRILSGALVIAGLLALVGAGAAWIRSARDSRPLKPDFEGLGPAFDRWVRGITPREEKPQAENVMGPSGPWASLIVVSGKDRGQRFVLNDDTELIGRAEYCSVRIDDKSVQPAHLLIHRDGTFRTSTPRSEVEVDGKRGLWGSLTNGSLLRLGNVSLEFRHES